MSNRFRVITSQRPKITALPTPEVTELTGNYGWLLWDEAVAQLDAKAALQASLDRHHVQVLDLFTADEDDLRLL